MDTSDKTTSGFVAIITTGTRGDLQPCVALALGLKKNGIRYRVITNKIYESILQDHGLDYHLMGGDPMEVMNSKVVQECLAKGDMKLLIEKNPGEVLFGQSLQDIEDGCHGASLIMATPMTFRQGITMSEKLQVPFAALSLVPWAPTRASKFITLVKFPETDSTPEENGEGHEKYLQILSQRSVESWNVWRTTLGLKDITCSYGVMGLIAASGLPQLCVYSPALFPKPAEWGSQCNVFGNLVVNMEQENQLSEEVEQFLNASDNQPIFLSLGSMPVPEPLKLLAMIKSVIEKTGCRVIFSAGWTSEFQGENEESDSNLLIVGCIPHDLIFPRCAAILHHCGAGTTGAAARSGSPSIPVPFLPSDQDFWSVQLYRSGAATEPIPFPQLSEETLVKAIKSVIGNAEMKQAAKDLAEKVNADLDPVQSAVEIVKNLLQEGTAIVTESISTMTSEECKGKLFNPAK